MVFCGFVSYWYVIKCVKNRELYLETQFWFLSISIFSYFKNSKKSKNEDKPLKLVLVWKLLTRGIQKWQSFSFPVWLFSSYEFLFIFYYFFRYIFTKWQSDYVYTHWKVLTSYRDGCINAMNIRKAFLSYLWCLSSAELRIISIPYKRFWRLFGTG